MKKILFIVCLLSIYANAVYAGMRTDTLDTGQGANELYDMDQNVQTTSAVTFATVDTGQGANELYDMDQNVLTTSSPYFASLGINKTTPAESVDIWGGDLRFSKVAKPSSAPTLATGGAGALTGNYKYCFTYYTSNGETECSTASGTYAASAEQIAVTFTTSAETITGRKIYRTQAGGSVYNLVTTIANNSATSYTDNATDASIVSAAESPTNNTTGATLMVDAVESGFLGEESTYFGFHSGEDAVGGAWVNTGVGAYALANVTTGDYNTAIGYQALFTLTTGQYNNAFGRQAMRSATTADRNVAFGMGGLYALQTGSHNVAVGVDAMNTATSMSDNVGVGYHSMRLKTAGDFNVGVGSNTGEDLDTGEDNTMIGYLAYSNATAGDGNIYIGANAGDAITTSTTNTILIGRDSDTTNGRSNAGCIGTGCNPGADNAFVIGGTTPFNVGIDDSTPDHKLDVNGNIGMTASSYINFGDTDGTTGYGIRDNAGTIECKNSAGAWSACQDGTGAGGGDPVLIDGVAVSDGSGVDLIGGTNGIDISFNAGVSPDTATFNLDLSEISAGDLANDSVLEADLKVVDAPSDEDILTYESTTGDFEWHSPTDLETSFEAVLDLSDLQGAVTDAQVPDTVTASNYLALSGGTMTGQIVSDNLGVEFDESDTNPTCAAGNFNIYADLSENKLKMCQNGSASDLGGSGSGDVTAVGPGCSTGACFTDTVTTTGSDLVVWEGSTSDANEFTISVPSDPAADRTATFQAVTGNLPVVIDRDVTSSSLVNDTAETTMYSYSIPANTLGSDGMIRLQWAGEFLNNTGGSATLVVRVKLGSTTIFDTNTVLAGTNSASERNLAGHCWISAQNATNAQASYCQASMGATSTTGGSAGGAVFRPEAVHNSIAEDSTTALTLSITFDFASASTSLRADLNFAQTEKL